MRTDSSLRVGVPASGSQLLFSDRHRRRLNQHGIQTVVKSLEKPVELDERVQRY